MSEELEALGRRAVACKGWRWMPGMLAVHRTAHPGLRLTVIADGGNALQEARWFPDLSDAATLGCLLALVREAWGSPRINTDWGWNRWEIDHPDHEECIAKAATEAEALVAALEAAP